MDPIKHFTGFEITSTQWLLLGVAWFLCLFGAVIFYLHASFETDAGMQRDNTMRESSVDVSYFPRLIISGAVMIIRGLFIVVSTVLERTHDVVIHFWQSNFKREIVKKYLVMHRVVSDTQIRIRRVIANFRFNAFVDWIWLKYQEIRDWLARYLLFIPGVIIVTLLIISPHLPAKDPEPRFPRKSQYTPPARPKTDGYRGSTTTAIAAATTTKASIPTPKILESVGIPQPTRFWATYGDSLDRKDDATDSLADGNDKGRISTVEADLWESEFESFQKTPVPRQGVYPGEYWDSAYSKGFPAVRFVSKDLHWCLACKQVRTTAGRISQSG